MSVIYKYPLPPFDAVQWVTMPSSSTVLSAIEQKGQIILYALVPDPNASSLWNSQKRILVLGTGQTFNEDRENDIRPFDEMRFINTVKVGNFVWHIFELVEVKPYGES